MLRVNAQVIMVINYSLTVTTHAHRLVRAVYDGSDTGP